MSRSLSVAAIVFALPGVAHAHPGGSHAHGLMDGFLHPFGGVDHLAAMLGVGLLAAQCGGRRAWVLQLAWAAGMALGGAAAFAHMALPLVEPAIVASVIVFGLWIAAAAELPIYLGAGVVALGAFAHGQAHVVEMSPSASVALYGAGFLGASCLLAFSGYCVGLVVCRGAPVNSLRFAGGALALCGLALCLA